MGIYISLREETFKMDANKKDKALAAIKKLCKKNKDYSWVENDKVLDAKTFEEAMQEWRYPVSVDEKGNVCQIEFIGEKLGDEEELFKAIAPFVKRGSYLVMEIEQDFYKWAFDGKTFKEKCGHIEF